MIEGDSKSKIFYQPVVPCGATRITYRSSNMQISGAAINARANVMA
jgi:hypothetical protein